MKKSKFALISSVLILAMILGQITSVRGTTYTCTGVVGAEAVWKVKTVHEGALTEIFGVDWMVDIISSFGPGSNVIGARMKTLVIGVNSSTQAFIAGVGVCDVCALNTTIWWWTTSPFNNSSPDIIGLVQNILMHPKNLTDYATYWSGFFGFGLGNVSQSAGYPYLNGLPKPVETYLAELNWDNDYTITGTLVTHNVVAPYTGGNYLALIDYYVDCTETWRYSSQYGTFLGYKLVHNNGTTAYETELEVAEAIIPGFELPIVIGVSMGLTIGLIFVIMKKKK